MKVNNNINNKALDMAFASTPLLLGNKLYSDREKTGDVTFIVGPERISAHRSVLAALSPKYDTQFYGSHRDEGDVIVENVSPKAFKEFLKLFYLGEADLKLENIEEILNLAEQCLVKHHVQQKIENLLKSSVTTMNVCRIYELALLFDLNVIRKCELIISVNISQIIASDEFLELHLDTLLGVLDIKHLNCKEKDIFEGCIEWAEKVCLRKGLDDGKAENLRAQLKEAVKKIRFSSMSVQDLVILNETYRGILSSEEFVEITKIIVGHPEFTSENFNQARRQRIVKFQPLPETVIESTVKTKMWCISAMEEFKDESLEELRLKHY